MTSPASTPLRRPRPRPRPRPRHPLPPAPPRPRRPARRPSPTATSGCRTIRCRARRASLRQGGLAVARHGGQLRGQRAGGRERPHRVVLPATLRRRSGVQRPHPARRTGQPIRDRTGRPGREPPVVRAQYRGAAHTPDGPLGQQHRGDRFRAAVPRTLALLPPHAAGAPRAPRAGLAAHPRDGERALRLGQREARRHARQQPRALRGRGPDAAAEHRCPALARALGPAVRHLARVQLPAGGG